MAFEKASCPKGLHSCPGLGMVFPNLVLPQKVHEPLSWPPPQWEAQKADHRLRQQQITGNSNERRTWTVTATILINNKSIQERQWSTYKNAQHEPWDNEQCLKMPHVFRTRSHGLLLGSQSVPFSLPLAVMRGGTVTSGSWPKLGTIPIVICQRGSKERKCEGKARIILKWKKRSSLYHKQTVKMSMLLTKELITVP